MVNALEITKALALLRNCAPVEPVELWIRCRPDTSIEFVARIDGGFGKESTGPDVFGWGSNPVDAALHCIKQAGDRSPDTLKRAKCDDLRKQLEELTA